MIDIYVDIDDSFIAAGAWNPNGSYTKGDRVYDNSSQSINNLSPIYACVNDNSNSAPSSSSTDWILAGTSPEYPLLTKDPMETSIVDTTHSISKPWEYEWSFDGSNISGNPVMRHYRMIEEAGGGRVIFMFETFDSPHTGTANIEAMLKIIPGPILSNTTKITFDSYSKNTTIIYNGYGGNPNNGPSFGLSQFDSLDDPRANNYYFNNLTFVSTEGFSSLFGIAAGEFTGCKFIKTEYVGSSGSGGHRFFTNNSGSKVKAKFVQCLFEQSYGIGVNGESSATEFIGCTFVYNNFDSVNAYAPTSLGGMFSRTLKTFKDNIFYIKKIQDFNSSQSYSVHSKVMHDGTIYMATFGAYTSGSSTTPYDSNSDWGIFDTNLSINAIEKSNNIIYIEGYESDSNYVGITYQDPMLVDPGSSDYRLRPLSPLIGGISSNLSRDELYVTPAEQAGPISFDTPVGNHAFYTFSSYTGDKFIATMRTSYNGEIYECLVTHDYDSTQDPSSDSTNWRLVEGTINDPYKSCDFNDNEGAIINKLTSNHDLILLDGDYGYFPITSDSSYPNTSPTLKALNKHKAIIFQGGFRPAGFLTKNLVFQNSLAVNGYSDYPLEGRVGFDLDNCVIHSSGYWWPPLNCVVTACLIFHNLNSARGMFYGAFGQASSPAPSDKAITFTNNTFIFTGSLDSANDSVLSSLINQGNHYATFKRNIFYAKSEFNPGPCTSWANSAFSNSQLVFEENVAFDENGVIVDDLRGMTYIDPRLVDTSSNEHAAFRLRSDSPLIGGLSKYPSVSTSIWYVDLIGGDDANNGKTPDTAMLTISAAHAASIHLDTIFIVNENISVSSDLDFPGGRKYESLTKCTIDFNDNYSSSISAAAGLDTYIKGFDFIKMRGDYSLLSISSDVNSLFVIESCKFEGILTHSQSAPIGGNGISSRNARQGSMIKGCSFDIGWSTQTSGGSTSCGFIAVDRTDIVACTFWVKDSTPLGSTNLYLVGTGGQGAHSHGPPIGPIEVKNCIVHGNDRMHYGMSTSGNGGNLGFTSNARVSVNSANYVIHNCCLYGINGTPMEIDNSTSNNRYNNGSIVNDRAILREWIENIFTEDPQFIDPSGGNLQLKPQSPLIGQGS